MSSFVCVCGHSSVNHAFGTCNEWDVNCKCKKLEAPKGTKMTAPDKPGLSNEEGKPTPGQIGGEEALKFQDAQTLAAYWVMSDSENRRKMWESDIKKICEALLSVSRQGQEERDYTPEEAQLEVTKRFGQGSSVQVDFEVNSDWTWTKRVTLFDWESNEISEAETFREAFAAADAAKKEGGK